MPLLVCAFGNRVFCLFANGGEAFGVLNRDVRKHFAVDFDVREGESVDQSGIRKIVQPCGGVDTRDPQFAEISFSPTAVAVSVRQRVHDLFFGGAVQKVFGAEIALRQFDDFLATFAADDAAFYSGHGSCPLVLQVRDLMLDASDVGGGDDFASAVLTVLFGRFVAHQVAAEGAAANKQTGRGAFESLFGPGMGLHLGHDSILHCMHYCFFFG